jgi:hypothetical protein
LDPLHFKWRGFSPFSYKVGHSYLFTFSFSPYENVKRQLCPYFITK